MFSLNSPPITRLDPRKCDMQLSSVHLPDTQVRIVAMDRDATHERAEWRNDSLA